MLGFSPLAAVALADDGDGDGAQLIVEAAATVSATSGFNISALRSRTVDALADASVSSAASVVISASVAANASCSLSVVAGTSVTRNAFALTNIDTSATATAKKIVKVFSNLSSAAQVIVIGQKQVKGSAQASTLCTVAARAFKIWELQPDTVETWSQQSDTSEVWVEQLNTSEIWANVA